MAGRIPQSFIDDLLVRTDIVELIDSRVRLKKAGKNYQACCPFHNEKSPSFTVSQEKQFYHCFGCGAHGNAIGFVMEYDGLEFPDAIEELASLHGMQVPREQTAGGSSHSQPAVSKDLFELMNQIARFYESNLKNAPQAVEYLKGRGLTGEVVKRFNIGYAPGDWDQVRRRFGASRDHEQLLISGGMLIPRDSGPGSYDRFRDRIMFPIRDKRGRVIGFGGRVLGDGTGGDMPLYPMGASQGSATALGYTQSWTMSGGSSGELYLSKLEKRLLGLGSRVGAHSPLEDLT